MKFFLCLLLINICNILSEEEEEDISSPCESVNKTDKPEDCIGKSCEFIEEICCYIEFREINSTEIKKECIDFEYYHYLREDLKKEAIERIKNKTYWDEEDKNNYSEILTLKCNNNYLVIKFFLLLLISFFII